jgi:hypothetical protein
MRPTLLHLSRQLVDQYVLFPRDKLTRGQLEAMLPPLSRMKSLLEEIGRGMGREAMAEDIKKWRDGLTKALEQSNGIVETPAVQNAFWDHDVYLKLLLSAATGDLPDSKQFPRRTLSYLVLQSTRETLEENQHYLVALYWLDLASRGQNELNKFLGEKGKAPETRTKQVKTDWENALKLIENYLSEHGPAPGSPNWSKQMFVLRERWERMADLALIQEFFNTVHRSLCLRLEQIDALMVLGQSAQARARAEELAADAQKIRDSTELQALLDAVKAKLKASNEDTRKEQMQVHAQLAKTLETGGSIAWIGHAAAVRAAGQ